MNLLVDTHAVIWFITDSPNLPVAVRKIIEEKENNCYVSLASFWEMGIKYSLDRLELNAGLEVIFQIIEESGFELLPITPGHVLEIAKMQFYHQDPFDRLIIGQAITEDLCIVTKDEQFQKYGVPIIWK